MKVLFIVFHDNGGGFAYHDVSAYKNYWCKDYRNLKGLLALLNWQDGYIKL